MLLLIIRNEELRSQEHHLGDTKTTVFDYPRGLQ